FRQIVDDLLAGGGGGLAKLRNEGRRAQDQYAEGVLNRHGSRNRRFLLSRLWNFSERWRRRQPGEQFARAQVPPEELHSYRFLALADFVELVNQRFVLADRHDRAHEFGIRVFAAADDFPRGADFDLLDDGLGQFEFNAADEGLVLEDR